MNNRQQIKDERETYYIGGKPYFGIPPVKKEAEKNPERLSPKKQYKKTSKTEITKIVYDAAYISYVENGESAAVFITRDIAINVPTGGKWVDMLQTDGWKRRDGRWVFKEFTVELFPRKKHPVYPENASDEQKKYITWKTAHEDISEQRKNGAKGPMYRIFPKLVNRNPSNGKPKWEYDITRVEKI